MIYILIFYEYLNDYKNRDYYNNNTLYCYNNYNLKEEFFNGKIVNVTGVVEGWILSSDNFTLVDSLNSSVKISIIHDRGFPGGFGNNETVVVSGIFYSEVNFIESQSIQIGCPSKY